MAFDHGFGSGQCIGKEGVEDTDHAIRSRFYN